MWEGESSAMPSVLIVESNNGDVFIVEPKNSKSQVEKILADDPSSEKSPKKLRRKVGTKVEVHDPSPVEEVGNNYFKPESDEDVIVEEYLDEYFEENEGLAEPTYEIIEYGMDIKTEIKTEQYNFEEYEIKFEGEDEIPEAIRDHQYMIPQPTFDGNYTSDESESLDADTTSKRRDDTEKSGKMQKHKIRQLTGKPACKYCDTIFRSKESFKMHSCVYLQCNPRNFICRICNKELSKKTFSNHLHETTDCQYCGKSFVNPRNLKTHVKSMHKYEKFIPPKSPNRDFLKLFENTDETLEPVLDEETGLMMTNVKKKKYPRKTGRFECDLCGRVFTTVRSLNAHMDLHTNNHRYVCSTCGEKYATHTGITKHACMNKRRKRPEYDFRTFDVRHCKYCGLQFETFEENKAHNCENQFEDQPKLFRCRFCNIDMSKSSYNKHMGRHLEPDKEYICGYCNKKLSDENGLAIHLTIHTGDKPYKCTFEDCGMSFINKQLLTRHSRFHGVEIPVYTCKMCNKEVASKYHLKSHMKTHNDQVECQLCKSIFETRDELKDHYQAKHVPYPCSQCDKMFTLPRYLKMHEKLHNPLEKGFLCEFCMATKAFTKMALLLNHVYKSHPEQFDTWKEHHPEIFK